MRIGRSGSKRRIRRDRSADDADRHAAGDGLAVDDHVGLDAEELLRAAGREPEARVDLVEDERDVARRHRPRAARAATRA